MMRIAAFLALFFLAMFSSSSSSMGVLATTTTANEEDNNDRMMAEGNKDGGELQMPSPFVMAMAHQANRTGDHILTANYGNLTNTTKSSNLRSGSGGSWVMSASCESYNGVTWQARVCAGTRCSQWSTVGRLTFTVAAGKTITARGECASSPGYSVYRCLAVAIAGDYASDADGSCRSSTRSFSLSWTVKG